MLLCLVTACCTKWVTSAVCYPDSGHFQNCSRRTWQCVIAAYPLCLRAAVPAALSPILSSFCNLIPTESSSVFTSQCKPPSLWGPPCLFSGDCSVDSTSVFCLVFVCSRSTRFYFKNVHWVHLLQGHQCFGRAGQMGLHPRWPLLDLGSVFLQSWWRPIFVGFPPRSLCSSYSSQCVPHAWWQFGGTESTVYGHG